MPLSLTRLFSDAKYFLIVFLVGFLSGSNVFSQSKDNIVSQSSPDKQLDLYFRLHEGIAIDYRVEYHKREILGWSPLGLVTNNGSIPSGRISDPKITRTGKDETFAWPFGENATIHNQYNQINLQYQREDGLGFTIEARVFNDNLAFRYVLPVGSAKSSIAILKENTGFQFTSPYTVYRHNTESVFSPTPINELKNPSDFPLILASPKMYISINEAANDQYTKAMIGKAETENALDIKFGKDTVKLSGTFVSPWRTLSFSETAIGLRNSSDLLYKLNDKPDPLKDYSWIKPGKLLRDMTLSTQGALDCIDFAQKMKFQYIMFDAGWYGKGYAAEFDKDSDPVKVVDNIDMPKVISHGKEKGIGLILYVNYVGLKKNNLDTLFTLYKSWGVKGLKFGFVNGLSQEGISWLMKAVKKAQGYGFIINVHDNYKPTGISRTIPAFLTQEGVRGNENNPDAFHNTTLPFTRFLSGPADYTFCYRSQSDSFNNTLLSKKLQVSQAQQLALTVIYYSPLQSMLWYGRPAYYQLPEQIEFFKQVSTTWDKTLNLKGEIGEYIIVARKKAGKWFIGSATNDKPYQTTIKLDFLDRGKKYAAVIYGDDGKGGVVKRIMNVNSNSVLGIDIAAKGGEVVMISLKE
jgi:alpha-glucosidase